MYHEVLLCPSIHRCSSRPWLKELPTRTGHHTGGVSNPDGTVIDVATVPAVVGTAPAWALYNSRRICIVVTDVEFIHLISYVLRVVGCVRRGMERGEGGSIYFLLCAWYVPDKVNIFASHL